MTLLIPDPTDDQKIVVFTFGEDPDHVLVHVQYKQSRRRRGGQADRRRRPHAPDPGARPGRGAGRLAVARGWDEEVLQRWESFREYIRLMKVDPLD